MNISSDKFVGKKWVKFFHKVGWVLYILRGDRLGEKKKGGGEVEGDNSHDNTVEEVELEGEEEEEKSELMNASKD